MRANAKSKKSRPDKALSPVPRKKTRAETRQEAFIGKTLLEKKYIDIMLNSLGDKLFSLDHKSLNPIDRHMMLTQYHIMEAYSSILWMIANFERLRTRDRNGENLHRSQEDFLRFIYGDSAALEHEPNRCCGTFGKCQCHQKN